VRGRVVLAREVREDDVRQAVVHALGEELRGLAVRQVALVAPDALLERPGVAALHQQVLVVVELKHGDREAAEHIELNLDEH
jgi:hypothetical protein